MNLKKFKTVRFRYDRESRRFYSVRGLDIVARSFDQAEAFCSMFHPDLIVVEEIEKYREELLIGDTYFEFNYN